MMKEEGRRKKDEGRRKKEEEEARLIVRGTIGVVAFGAGGRGRKKEEA